MKGVQHLARRVALQALHDSGGGGDSRGMRGGCGAPQQAGAENRPAQARRIRIGLFAFPLDQPPAKPGDGGT